MITISIDVTQLDKSRFKEVTRQGGKKAVFCDLVLIETPNGQYGDFMVKQSVTKQEREAKLEMPILGNGKNWNKTDTGTRRQSTPAAAKPATELPPVSDDVPF